MFEKDAEERITEQFGTSGEYVTRQRIWQDGAEFGYNKANEWHYPSKGEYPKEDKRYLCKIKGFVGGGISYECFDYDAEYNSWKNANGDVIAWKEVED